MNRPLLKAAAALFLCSAVLTASASTTTVTATLTDSDGTPWKNCAWIAIVSSPVPPTIAGVGVPDTSLRANGSCDASGVLTATMLNTSSVQQSGVTWTFTIQPNASVGPSVVSGIAVTGSSINLSTPLSSGITAPRFSGGANAYGYANVEVTSGDSYFNTGSVGGYCKNTLAGWACGGGGGGGPVASVNGQTGTVVLGFADVGAAAVSEPIGAAAQTTANAAQATANAAIPLTQKAAANGVASLGAGGLVPAAQLGTGTASGANALFGDGTYKPIIAPIQGAGAPTAACTAGQVYTQTDASTFPTDLSKWTCSKNAVIWTNAATGVVSTAVANAYVTSGALGFYELQAGTGTTYADTSGNGNTLSNCAAGGVTWNGTNGVNIGATSNNVPRAICGPAAWFVQGNTFMVCATPHVGTPLVAGGNGDTGMMGVDSTGRMMMGSSFSFPVIGSISTAFSLKTGPICLTYTAGAGGSNVMTAGTANATVFTENQNYAIVPGAASIGFGGWPAGAGNGGVGAGAAGIMYKVYVWSRTLDIDERQEMALAAQAKLVTQGLTPVDGFVIPQAPPTLVTIGDSQTSGQGSTATPPGYPPLLAAAIPGGVSLFNSGLASAQNAQIALTVAQLPALNTQLGNPALKFATIWGGTNDTFSGATPAALYTAYATVAKNVHTAGFKDLYFTIIPALRCLTTCEANRVTYNGLVLAAPFTDGLVDIGDDLRFTNPQFTPWLSNDSLHPSDLGYAAIAKRALTELNRLKFSGDSPIVGVPCSATPDFDLSKSLHQYMNLTCNVTRISVSGGNQGTQFQLDFIQAATGGMTVGIGTIGSGATATAPLTGSAPVFTLGSGGTNYSTLYPPIVVVTGGTCTTFPQFLATVSGGAVTGATTRIAGNCSVAPTLTLVSTEPVWAGPKNIVSLVPNISTSLLGSFDGTGTNVLIQANTFLASTAATATSGIGVTSVTCATATCTNMRGTLTIVGGTATTGVIASVAYPATPAPYACTAYMNGGATTFGIGNSVATSTGFDITAAISVLGATLTVNYTCQP